MGMTGTVRDGVDGFTGDSVRGGMRGEGRDGGVGGLPARTGGGGLRGGGGGVDASSSETELGGGSLWVIVGLGGTALDGSDGAEDDDDDLSFGTAGGRPKADCFLNKQKSKNEFGGEDWKMLP